MAASAASVLTSLVADVCDVDAAHDDYLTSVAARVDRLPELLNNALASSPGAQGVAALDRCGNQGARGVSPLCCMLMLRLT